MVTIEKPEIIDGPHGMMDSTDEWSQDDFTLYQMTRIAEAMERIRGEWLGGRADAHTVTMSQWVAKWSLDVTSRLAEILIQQQEEEAGA